MTNPMDIKATPRRPFAISMALILFGLLAVPIGLANPGGAPSAHHQNANVETMAALQIARADARFGFPVPQRSDTTPRGPEPA